MYRSSFAPKILAIVVSVAVISITIVSSFALDKVAGKTKTVPAQKQVSSQKKMPSKANKMLISPKPPKPIIIDREQGQPEKTPQILVNPSHGGEKSDK